MRTLSWLKKRLNWILRGFNFEIRKYPSAAIEPLPVFNLAVQLLMKRRGHRLFFVQVGANDGVLGDPLRQYILKYRWQGILIEPQPDIFELLVQNYEERSADLIFENCAISPEHASLTLYVPKLVDRSEASIYRSSVASVRKESVARQLRLQKQDLKSIEVPCKSLDRLIAEHGVTGVDVLQIDAEGHDYHVLRSLDLKRLRPAVIQFETGHLAARECQLAADLLQRAGYCLYWAGNQGDAVAMLGDLAREI